MILWPRRKLRGRYPDITVVLSDGRVGRLEAKVVWGETDIKSIIARLPRVRPGVTRDPKGDHAST